MLLTCIICVKRVYVCMGGWDTDVRRCISKTPTVHTLQHSMNTVGMTITAPAAGIELQGKVSGLEDPIPRSAHTNKHFVIPCIFPRALLYFKPCTSVHHTLLLSLKAT